MDRTFAVGDRVRVIPHGDEHDPEDDGLVSTITKDKGEGWTFRYVLADEPPSESLNAYGAAELELVQDDSQPTQEKTHDYMLGYADGYRHPGYVDGVLTVEPNESAQYRAGFLAGWDASIAEDREAVAAALLS